VARTWGDANLRAGDEIALSVAEHHSNLIPWQLLARRTGAVLRFAPLGPAGEPTLDGWAAAITPRTRLVATAAVSNVLGYAAPVSALVEMAAAVGARVLLDACQSVPHAPTDVSTLGVDFLVASGHKMCGPTGIGFLWARPEILASMPPWQGGGEMIADVGLHASTFAEPPARFEAGTPAIAQAIGLGAACDYLSALGMRNVAAWEADMGGYLYEKLAAVPGVTLYGPQPGGGGKGGHARAALAAFNVAGLHATDVSTLLDASGVALRSGHHCCQPLHAALGVGATARASLYVYNTAAEVDDFVAALSDVCAFLREAGA
jgi:cysteine desulfurase/selenocysteine lyase